MTVWKKARRWVLYSLVVCLASSCLPASPTLSPTILPTALPTSSPTALPTPVNEGPKVSPADNTPYPSAYSIPTRLPDITLNTPAVAPPTATNLRPKSTPVGAEGSRYGKFPRVVSGYGEFPRMVYVLPLQTGLGLTYGVYLIQGSTAREIRRYGPSVEIRAYEISPDKRNVAVIFQQGEDSFLEVIDLGRKTYQVIYEGKRIGSGSDVFLQPIYSVVWIDDEHFIFNKSEHQSIKYMKQDGQTMKEPPSPINYEIWATKVDGTERKKLSDAPAYRILAPDRSGKKLYVTREIEPYWRLEGFSILDLETGQLENLWPSEEKPKPFYYGMNLIVLPDGSPRIEYAYVEQGPGSTIAGIPTALMLGDPETGKLENIWNGKLHQFKIFKDMPYNYPLPSKILWSPTSPNEFITIVSSNSGSKLWKSYLAPDREEVCLGESKGSLVSWTNEGIVTYDSRTSSLILLDAQGNVIGEIRF